MSYPGKPHRAHVSTPPISILGSSLVHWIRFDLEQCSLATNRIAQANDRINHNNVVQPTNTQRPTFGSQGQNNRTYGAFNPADAGGLLQPSGFSGWNAGDGVYVWAVAKWDTLGDYVMTSNYTPAGGAYDQGATVRKNNVNACQFFVNLGGGVGIKSVATPNNSIGNTTAYYIEGWIDPGAAQIKCAISGGTAASTPVTNFGLASAIGRCALGQRVDFPSDYFGGRLYECGAAKAYSPTAQTAMRQYFAGYYGL